MSPEETALIIFAKEPVAGNVKTRLGDEIGHENACAVYRAFLKDIAVLCGTLTDRLEGLDQPWLAYSGEAASPGFRPFRGSGFRLTEQASGDLGTRLEIAVRDSFSAGFENVLIIGSDSPTLQPRLFEDAEMTLRHATGKHVVVGPSFDGGYYLIGMNCPASEVFQEVDWSTPDVLEQTLQRAHEAGYETTLTDFWYDVDNLRDLKFMSSHAKNYLKKTSKENQAPNTLDVIRRLEPL